MIRMNRRTFLAATCASPFAAPFLVLGKSTTNPTKPIDTTSGKLRGTDSSGVSIFKGIPYGAPTSGGARFLPPAKPQPWTGVRDATQLGPSSAQVIRLLIPEIRDAYAVSTPATEDSLRVNVWTPARNKNQKLPVMFYMHGGGFRTGSGGSVLYDGEQLARKHGVVVVTVNHRLGVMGYLHLAHLGGEFAQASNVGMLDLVAALEWVRDNIANFGGDPGNVTIWGQSGGGGKTAMLTAWPAAKGLFHRAIIHSTLIDTAVRALTQEEAVKTTSEFLTRLNLKPEQAGRLRDLPVDQILAAVVNNPKLIATGPDDWSQRFTPCVDGRTLLRHPYDPTAPEVSATVPLLCGAVATETVPYTGPNDPYWSIADLDNDGLLASVKGTLRCSDADARKVVDAYRKNTTSAPRQAGKRKYSNMDLAMLIAADNAPTRRSEYVLAERKAQQGKAPAYLYSFNWFSPVRDGHIRAMHSVDLPFAFDHVDQCNFLVGNGPERQKLADRISTAWVNFARTGNPNHKDLPHWDPYTPDRRATMVLDSECVAANDPWHEERLALEGLQRG